MSKNRTSYERKEVEEACRKLSSFKDIEFDVSQVPAWLESLDYKATPEMLAEYKRFYTELFHGKVPLELSVAGMASVGDTAELVKICVKACDRNKDGFIDEKELKIIIEVLLVHDPEFPRVNFQDFVKHADTNKDGKVSIDEAVAWFTKTIKK